MTAPRAQTQLRCQIIGPLSVLKPSLITDIAYLENKDFAGFTLPLRIHTSGHALFRHRFKFTSHPYALHAVGSEAVTYRMFSTIIQPSDTKHLTVQRIYEAVAELRFRPVVGCRNEPSLYRL